MTTSDTIGRVPRPRGVLTSAQVARLTHYRELREEADREYRKLVVNYLALSSFSAVAEATGLSKDTLQRWKREAGK